MNLDRARDEYGYTIALQHDGAFGGIVGSVGYINPPTRNVTHRITATLGRGDMVRYDYLTVDMGTLLPIGEGSAYSLGDLIRRLAEWDGLLVLADR